VPAPRLTTEQARHLASRRVEAERIAAQGGHVIGWEGTFSDSSNGGGTFHRSQDGYCSEGGRFHLRAVVSVAYDDIIWQLSRPDDRCPGAA
jgi:hypothetical protein